MDLSRIAWRKASYSTGNGGDCVELSTVARTVAVRDSKDPDSPALAVTAGNWRALTRSGKRGDADPV